MFDTEDGGYFLPKCCPSFNGIYGVILQRVKTFRTHGLRDICIIRRAFILDFGLDD
jgi:hypothetical protein